MSNATPTLLARPSDLHVGPTLAYPRLDPLPADLLAALAPDTLSPAELEMVALLREHVCGEFTEAQAGIVAGRALEIMKSGCSAVSALEDAALELKEGSLA